MSQEMKTCPVCGIEKPVTDFYRHENRPGGLTGYCKICHNRKDWERRKNNADRRKQTRKRTRAYYWKVTRKRPRKSDALVSVEANRFKTDMLKFDIRKPKQCERCGNGEDEIIMLPLFTDPFSFLWVCRQCYRELLRQKRAWRQVGQNKP